MKPNKRSTPAGEHRPVLLDEVLEILAPKPGDVIVDCTAGWAGHSAEILQRVGPTGCLLAMDLDGENLARARDRLSAIGNPFFLVHGNFAGLATAMANHGIVAATGILADLGMSSMQVDEPDRGFSYSRDGVLDMRMDRSRGQSAAQLLAVIPEQDLAKHLREIGDEPEAERIAAAIVAWRTEGLLQRTRDLANVILKAVQGEKPWQLHPGHREWKTHPAARTFQTLRILVNRELANLEHLLRVLPQCLTSGGIGAIISFHSGEDRRVKAAFRVGQQEGKYSAISPDLIRASFGERTANPRSRSAKLRWAQRS